MAKDVTAHDATQDLNEAFNAPRASKIIVTVKTTGITAAGAPRYFFRHSNIDTTGGDNVPAIPTGVMITSGTNSFTFEVLSPAKNLEHFFDHGAISAGTLDIDTKIIYSND